MEEIHNLVICQYCKKVFQSPVILTCSNTLCKQHVEKLRLNESPNKIECFFCKTEHEIPENGFIPETNIEQLIKLNLDKLNFGETHQRALISCENFKNSLKKFESIQTDPMNYLKIYFSNLKTRINRRRDTLKTKIDNIANKMIEDLNIYEEDCKSKKPESKQNNDELVEFNLKLESWKNALNSFKIDVKKWLQVKTDAEITNKKLNELIIKHEKELLMNKSYNFDCVNLDAMYLVDELFGELKTTPSTSLFLVIFLFKSILFKSIFLNSYIFKEKCFQTWNRNQPKYE